MRGFSHRSVGKESTCNTEDLGSIPGSGRSPGERNGNPLQCSCLENPHGQRSLAGYSPRGCRELNTTEQLSTARLLLLAQEKDKLLLLLAPTGVMTVSLGIRKTDPASLLSTFAIGSKLLTFNFYFLIIEMGQVILTC